MLPRPPLAISLAGLERRDDAPWSAGPRAAIMWAAAAGFGSVQLDATASGLRPRELDRPARRDLAALLRRSGLAFCGLDLWIPPEHLLDPARAERALDAIVQAIDLAAEVGRLNAAPLPPTLSLVLPPAAPAEIVAAIVRDSNRSATPIADYAAGPRPAGIGVGIDPASLLLAGIDPAAAAARAGAELHGARLSDASLTGRVAPGSAGARLDLDAYLVSLSVAGYSRPVVLDLRGLHFQESVARSALAGW